MANLVRSAKSGSHWTKNELLAFNIRVTAVDMPAFFGCTELPPAPNFPVFLNNLGRPDGPLPKDERQFFQYMQLAQQASSEESAVDDFAAFILRTLGYDEPNCVVRLRKEMSFYMAGVSVDAKADVCVMNDLDYLLLVQEDKVSTLNVTIRPMAQQRAHSGVNRLKTLSRSLSQKLSLPFIKTTFGAHEQVFHPCHLH